MAIYFYKARDSEGQVYTGEIQASSNVEVASILQKRGFFVTLISDRPFGESIKQKRAVKKQITKREFGLFGRVTAEDKMVFSVQLANMVSAGLPLVQSLYIILQQMKNPKFYVVLEKVYQDVLSGSAFSDALEKHPGIFPEYFTSLVKAGEASGQLSTVLERIAAFTEHDMEVRQSMQAAMTYPVILIIVGTGIVFYIVTGVIPSFVATFLRIGVELPLPTQIMYNLSTFLRINWIFLLSALGFSIVFLRTAITTSAGRLWLDHLKLNLPFMGRMIERFSLSRFARTSGMLLGCGVPILLSFQIVQRNIGNEVFSRATEKSAKKIKQGVKISEALKETGVFPLDLIQMVAVGEETGKLDQLLNRLGDYYDTTAKYSAKKFLAMLEPIFLIVLGSFVSFIMASVLLPIFDMMKLLRAT